MKKNYVKTFESLFDGRGDSAVIYTEENFPMPGDTVKEIIVLYNGQKAYIKFESGKKTLIEGELWQLVGDDIISQLSDLYSKIPQSVLPYIVKDSEGLKILFTTRNIKIKTIEDLIALGVEIVDGTLFGYPVQFQNQFLKDTI